MDPRDWSLGTENSEVRGNLWDYAAVSSVCTSVLVLLTVRTC